ncbi:MAG: hypothetical protein L0216_12670 [Planctomycetales bacterium]|nr:hypothetical protein [Planctomycetales bacterium]
MRTIVAAAMGMVTGLAFGAGPVLAQDRAEERARRQAEQIVQTLTDRLALTAEQALKVREIVTASDKQSQDLRAEVDQKVSALQTESEGKVREILTEEQKPKFEEVMAEVRQNRDRRRQAGPGGAPGMPEGGARGDRGGPIGLSPDELAEKLKLTEDQKPQVQAAVQDLRKGLRDALQGGGQMDPQARVKAVQDAMAALKDRLGAVLTADQKPLLDQLLEEGRGRFGRRLREGAAGRPGGPERGRPEGGGPRDPAARAENRLQTILTDLKLTEDESLILRPKIEAILRLAGEMRTAADDEVKALETAVQADPQPASEEIKSKMEALRKARAEQDVKRTELEKELRDLVTLRQEAMLLLHRVLR